MRVSNELKNVDLPCYALNVTHILDLLLLKYFYGIFFAC